MHAATAVQEPAQHVVAEVVVAEQAGGCTERHPHDLVLAVGGEQRAEHRQQHDERGDDGADHEPALAADPAQTGAPGRRSGVGSRCERRHELIAVLARGVSRIESRSASRFTAT